MNKFQKFFMYLTMGLGTIQAVRQVESTVSEPKTGPAKLDLVVNTTTAAAMAVPEIAAEIKQKDVEAFSGTLAKATVAALNAAGVFKKS